MKYFIAMDGGGTKTDTILFDETGHIVLRDVGLGCNSMDMGAEPAKNRLKDIFARVYGQCPGGEVTAVFCGIAGCFPYAEAFRSEVLSGYKVGSVRMENDLGILISGMLGRVDGCAMVCGTGSGMGIRENGKIVTKIGGRGYLIDALGGGFALARDGIYNAFRALDGRGEPTILVELFERELGKPLESSVSDFYDGGRRYFASFAHLIFEGWEKGDMVCREILENGSWKLAEMTWAAAKHFAGEFPVVMNGGLFAAYPYYADMVKAKAAPGARMILSNVPPVYGSAVEAMADGGLECDEAFKETFLREYAEWKSRQ